jgi:inosine-uridine nucleoside N-ribohydrolase
LIGEKPDVEVMVEIDTGKFFDLLIDTLADYGLHEDGD